MEKKILKKKLLRLFRIPIMIMLLLFCGIFCMSNDKNVFAMNTFDFNIVQNQVDVSTTSETEEILADETIKEAETIETSPPSETTATVIEHMITDKEGQEIEHSGVEETEKGKEFYTIQTKDTEKIFYLIIDKDGTQETVYFLTQISEDDLMDVAAEGSGAYQSNSNTIDSAIPNNNSLLPNESNQTTENSIQEPQDITQELENENTEQIETDENNTAQEENPMAAYIFYGVIVVLAVLIGYYLKVYRKKKENFVDDEEDEEEIEEWETEKETDNEAEDDFLNQTETEEE